MRASRRYYSSVLSSLGMLDLFLASFIIFTIIIATVTAGASVFGNVNQFKHCGDDYCPWYLYRITIVLACAALGFLIIAFACSTYGVADQESLVLRSNVVKAGTYGGLEVVGPPKSFIATVLFTILGLVVIIIALLISVAAATSSNTWTTIASVVILGFFTLVAAIILLYIMVVRDEAPIVIQPVYATVPISSVAAPVAPASGLAPM